MLPLYNIQFFTVPSCPFVLPLYPYERRRISLNRLNWKSRPNDDERNVDLGQGNKRQTISVV